ncbi:homeotic protein proboscipedia isoform X2 [Topomyia yanbarensis]|nr:homeotic protein proboscipedia isoform X2 [Topomyia yanbarensis]XP_058826242.1 homeotic protein proboscipedia isoform X2 [Topomyia yanbarensis]
MKHKRQTLSKTDDEDSSKDDLKDSNSKKSCQGCELPSDDIPDSTSNSRGLNNSTPNNSVTPNSTIEISTPNCNTVNADSSVASCGSIDDDEDMPITISKKHINSTATKKESSISTKNVTHHMSQETRKDSNINIPQIPTTTNVITSSETISNPGMQSQYNQIVCTPMVKSKMQHQTVFDNVPTLNVSGCYGGLNKQEYFNKVDVSYHQYTKTLSAHQYMSHSSIGHKQDFPSTINVKKFCTRYHSEGTRIQQHHEGYPQNIHQNLHFYSNDSTTAQTSFSNVQCYHSNYDAQNEFNSNYCDPKSQAYYYDGTSYHPPNATESTNMQPSMEYQPNNNFVNTGSSENVHFHQPYYDAHQIHNPYHLGPNSNTTGNIEHHQLGHDSVYATHSSNFPISYGPNNTNIVSGNVSSNVTQLENSNSSSDFNFLSNLANDYAPEYYQLS